MSNVCNMHKAGRVGIGVGVGIVIVPVKTLEFSILNSRYNNTNINSNPQTLNMK